MENSSFNESKLSQTAQRLAVVDRHFVVVAIDFGSTYSGYMYAFKSDFKKDPTFVNTHIHCPNWKYGACDMTTAKTNTSVLLKPDKSFAAFGYEAEKMYSDMFSEDNGNPSKWYLFRNFKMQLYGRETLPRSLKIKDEQGKRLLALEVFTSAICYLKDHALKGLQEHADIRKEDIHWILTVPAIWTEPAKQFMRQAAIEAGIEGSRLILALEPEVAAIYCKEYEIKRKETDDGHAMLTTFDPGSKFMILDLGGGTVDITVYEVQQNQVLHEVHVASGGPWGGNKVNTAFMEIWKSIIGKENFRKFLLEYQDDVLFFYNSFESIKRQLKWNKDQTQSNEKSTLQLPDLFKQIDGFEGKVEAQCKNCITIKRGKASILNSFLESLFKECVEKIIEHIRGIFKSVNDVNSVLMVGGFSEAEVVKGALRNAFPEKRFFIPTECNSAVMRGAVMYGFKQSYIEQRISRYSYGISHRVPFDPQIHSIDHIFMVDGEAMCEDLFKTFVQAGEKLVPGETKVEHKFRATENPAVVALYASNKQEPLFVSDLDSSHIGDIRIYFDHFKHEKLVEVTMMFGNTEINVCAIDIETGKTERTKIDLLQ